MVGGSATFGAETSASGDQLHLHGLQGSSLANGHPADRVRDEEVARQSKSFAGVLEEHLLSAIRIHLCAVPGGLHGPDQVLLDSREHAPRESFLKERKDRAEVEVEMAGKRAAQPGDGIKMLVQAAIELL